MSIQDFWEFNNSNCWLIKRKCLVDMYLYLSTMKYIYKSSVRNIWYGTKNPTPMILLAEKDRKRKEFKSEKDAVKWLSK